MIQLLFLSLATLYSAHPAPQQKPKAPVTTPKKSSTTFGTCCRDLKEAMAVKGTSTFQIADNGVLLLSVGYMETPQGYGWFDQAVIFCPFCGKKLQDKDEIRRKTH